MWRWRCFEICEAIERPLRNLHRRRATGGPAGLAAEKCHGISTRRGRVAAPSCRHTQMTQETATYLTNIVIGAILAVLATHYWWKHREAATIRH